MAFDARRGGHAPGHLREAVEVCAEHRDGPWWASLATREPLEWWSPARQAWWNGLPARERGRWLTGQLWNCTDTVPGETCELLGLPRGSSYAQAARALRATL